MPLQFKRKRRHYNTEVLAGETETRVYNDLFLRQIALESIEKAEEVYQTLDLDNALTTVLEIGSAGGITKKLRPNWTTSDIRPSSGVDIVASAGTLSYGDSTIDMIYAQDVLHHIEDLAGFLHEANRVLVNGGVIFCKEPYWGPLAQIVFRFIHPEEFSRRRVRVNNSFGDPMAGNQALAWALVSGSGQIPKDFIERNGFEINKVGPILGWAFLLSGGTTFSTQFPRPLLMKIHNFEKGSQFWLKVFGLGYLFFLQKRNSPVDR
jgi:SAM-dependent methyltransferase